MTERGVRTLWHEFQDWQREMSQREALEWAATLKRGQDEQHQRHLWTDGCSNHFRPNTRTAE